VSGTWRSCLVREGDPVKAGQRIATVTPSSERHEGRVIGCGAMGAASAWRLSQRGAEVVGFDRFSPRMTRARRMAIHASPAPHHGRRVYVPLLQELPNVARSSRSGLARPADITGCLTIDVRTRSGQGHAGGGAPAHARREVLDAERSCAGVSGAHRGRRRGRGAGRTAGFCAPSGG